MKNIAVIGGGISGLYAAYLLLKKRYTVTIFEKNTQLGGRIYTERYDGTIIDYGAARFNKNHKLLFKLIEELNLIDELFPIKSKLSYIKDGVNKKLKVYEHIKHIIDVSKNVPTKHLKSITLQMFMKEYLEDSLVDDITYAFGYNIEFEEMNAYDAINLFKHDFLDDIQYYVFKNGLDKLTESLADKLKQSGCVFHMGKQIIEHRYMKASSKNVITVKDNEERIHNYTFDHTIFCITKSGLENVKGLENNKELNITLKTLGSGQLYRIFARFPVGKDGLVWFHDLNRVTTNNMLRYIIPIYTKRGFIMISYTDGRFADSWMNVKGDLSKVIMTHLHKLFPDKDIPEPLWIKKYYWREGIHYWKPGAVKYNNKNNMKEYNYCICGEVVSVNNHAWIEGALDSVNRIISYF